MRDKANNSRKKPQQVKKNSKRKVDEVEFSEEVVKKILNPSLRALSWKCHVFSL